MGTFYTNCRVENQVDRKQSVEVPKMLVDSGAEFTWINAETLKNIGVKPEKKDYTFVMANGQAITRPVGYAIIHVGDAVTREWWARQRHDESRIISYAVLAELARTPGRKRESALALVKNMPVLEAQEAVEEIVRFYLQHQLMPQGAFGDAVHLALASLHECDFLVTWNCKHLANANKLDHTHVNGLIGLTTPNLVTPLELLGSLYE